MRTSNQIYCDYLSARAKANALDKIADSIEKIGQNEVVEELDALGVSWQSDSMNIVKTKGSEVYNDLKARAGTLRKIAEVIRTIAVRNYRAEMRALELAKNRGYSGGNGGGGGR